MNYDPELEAKIALPHRRQQLLKVGEIRFGATKKQFERECRAKLTHGEKATFYWPKPAKPSHNHKGWAFVRFESRPQREEAQRELRGWVFKGLPTTVELPKKVAALPQSMRANKAGGNSTNSPKPAESSAASNPTPAAIHAASVEAVKSTPDAEKLEPAESAEPIKDPQPADAPESAKAPETSESPEPTKASDEADKDEADKDEATKSGAYFDGELELEEAGDNLGFDMSEINPKPFDMSSDDEEDVDFTLHDTSYESLDSDSDRESDQN